MGKLQNAFADLAGVLECKEKAEHQLIASISHDIKTPLTSVLGYSERLTASTAYCRYKLAHSCLYRGGCHHCSGLYNTYNLAR